MTAAQMTGRMLRRLRQSTRNTVATLREVALMPRDIGPVVPPTGDGEDVVVLVHGFMATGGVFRPLRARIEAELGLRVASFTHAPGVGLHAIARQLGQLVDRLHEGARVHVVGHSLGGLVARWYVQELGGHRRVQQTIALASPFGGAPIAGRIPVLVGRDLAPDAPVLRRLRERARHYSTPHLTIAGTHDALAPLDACAAFPHGDLVVLDGRGHNALLFDEEAMDLVVSRVAQHATKRRSAHEPHAPRSGVFRAPASHRHEHHGHHAPPQAHHGHVHHPEHDHALARGHHPLPPRAARGG
jgi:pimeloyl-ACP methyl ester carboxylesterase